MFDRIVLKVSKPVVDAAARCVHRAGFTADQVTLTAFAFGMLAALLIAAGHTNIAILPLLIGRGLDGVDGSLARLSQSTDRGAFLDISLDFLFYAAVPLAFATLDPLASAVLLAAFIGSGTSFLAYAIIAEKRGDKSTAYPSKAFYYLGGLSEGAETIICFVLMCLWPQHFTIFAYIFATMCVLTTGTRLIAGWTSFITKN